MEQISIRSKYIYTKPIFGSLSFSNVMIDGKNVFDQPIIMILKHENIRKIATGQGDDYINWLFVRLHVFL